MPQMIWLLAFFAFSLFLCLDRKKYTVAVYLCVCIVYTVIVAVIETPDTAAYRDYYYSINTNSYSYDDVYFEIGFQFLSKILKWCLPVDFNLYIAFLALLNISILFISCYRLYGSTSDKGGGAKVGKSKLCFLSLILYFSYYGLYYNAIVIRAGIALSIIMYLTTILRQKESLRHLFFILIILFFAFLFHSSALIGILVLLIYYSSSSSISRSVYTCVLLLILILYFSGKGYLLICSIINFDTLMNLSSMNLSRVELYLNQVSDSNMTSFNYIFNMFLAFLFVRKKNMPSFYYKYLNVFIFGLAIIAFFSSIIVIARVADYFTLFSFVLSALYLCDFKRDINFYLMSFLIVFIQLIFLMRIIL